MRDLPVVDDEMTGTPGTDASGRERSGRLTTMIPRPAARRASDAGRSRVGEGRRRGSRADRISSRRSAWLFGLAALVIVAALAAALFGLPVRTWFEQDERISALEYELGELEAVNDDLESEVGRLLSEAGIREAAREELGQIEPGDRRQAMPAMPALPRNFPVGWPYSQVSDILRVRADVAAAAASGAADHAVEPSGGGGGFRPLVDAADQPAPTAPAATSPTTSPTTVPVTSVGG
jgi:cell division protein FtsB